MSAQGPTAAAAVPLPQRNRKSAKQVDGSSPAPRKRRRRAVGSGAAEDCFTCASRQVSCDRRRPYCTQCLDLGGRCSGYKTTLTWGVGVASRGKLRGLSLPISGSQNVAAPVSQTTTRKSIPRSVSQAKAQPAGLTPTQTQSVRSQQSSAPSAHSSPYSTSASWASTVASIHVPPAAHHQASAQAPPIIPSFPQASYAHSSSPTEDISGQSIYTGLDPVNTPVEPTSFSSFHPTLWRTSPALQQFAKPPSPAYSEQSIYFQGNGPGNCLTNSYTAQDENEICQTSQVPPTACTTVSSQQQFAPHTIYQPFSNQVIGKTPRMRYLIGYYLEVLAPVIVAFDTPTSPFRLYMMELAKTSETLQHAIATLSLSNLRQRRKNWGPSTGKTLPSRRSCQALSRLTDSSMSEDFGLLNPDEQYREELLHKAIVIESVNSQLADPIARRSDALLATLLVLSIFHMCDTGMASFKTQFAGVKKLFSLRKNTKSFSTDVSKWFMRMFIWFDTMTAAVNDRDSQLGSELLDFAAQTGDEWALENLAGCDSRIFRLVAQLSRLNQLSQMKHVEPNDFMEKAVPSATPPPGILHYPGYSAPIYPHGTFISFPGDMPFNPYQNADPRALFWQEWYSMRQKLESWRLGLPESASPDTPSPITPTHTPTSVQCSSPAEFLPSTSSPASSLAHVPPANLPDVSNISESFRYAGLLYLERLANPDIPSSHPRIQNLVYGALHFITAVRSDVFLLWPLFITGAECVLESDRQIIRDRCCDIQKDSGFVNNLSCLQLLEKIWASESSQGATALSAHTTTASKGEYIGNPVGEMGQLATARPLLGGEGFKWKRIVDQEKMKDEYIVV
ncbi:predicted protein [Uncinocarpus reesii 1704]|uniref:Zn(2)-C6 fungal-type domain-containing protein n=1 Tax=Uncinocarpus reesii (strain UAMH 1704) TaxID=336963 RepID=C4JQC6_UNCRE|nr:uncharacterized protein UREG_04680 [Uncinocarpus reesii 1704]EEP79834.1 predicted protein [Uncinocarpus reesii 1704]